LLSNLRLVVADVDPYTLVHPSLHRPVLFVGVEPAVAALEIAMAFALVFGVGLHLATVALAAMWLTVVHGLMTWIAKQDPQMIALYLRSLRARDFYVATAPVHQAAAPIRASIPSI
jgi:type IV secretory pathway TrbD component